LTQIPGHLPSDVDFAIEIEYNRNQYNMYTGLKSKGSQPGRVYVICKRAIEAYELISKDNFHSPYSGVFSSVDIQRDLKRSVFEKMYKKRNSSE
jgi:hypothetical protein